MLCSTDCSDQLNGLFLYSSFILRNHSLNSSSVIYFFIVLSPFNLLTYLYYIPLSLVCQYPSCTYLRTMRPATDRPNPNIRSINRPPKTNTCSFTTWSTIDQSKRVLCNTLKNLYYVLYIICSTNPICSIWFFIIEENTIWILNNCFFWCSIWYNMDFCELYRFEMFL